MPCWYFVGYTAAEAVPFVCLGFTLISRCWLWAFGRKPLPSHAGEGPRSRAGAVSGTEAALYRLMTMIISVLGMVFQKPAQFYILALVPSGLCFFLQRLVIHCGRYGRECAVSIGLSRRMSAQSVILGRTTGLQTQFFLVFF